MISFCRCIYFGLTANQTTHSLKSLALSTATPGLADEFLTWKRDETSRVSPLSFSSAGVVVDVVAVFSDDPRTLTDATKLEYSQHVSWPKRKKNYQITTDEEQIIVFETHTSADATNRDSSQLAKIVLYTYGCIVNPIQLANGIRRTVIVFSQCNANCFHLKQFKLCKKCPWQDLFDQT